LHAVRDFVGGSNLLTPYIKPNLMYVWTQRTWTLLKMADVINCVLTEFVITVGVVIDGNNHEMM